MDETLHTAIDHVGQLHAGTDLGGGVAALGWLRALPGAQQLALPIDLFMVAVYCDDLSLQAAAVDGHGLRLSVTPVRSRVMRFQPRGFGLLAYALLTPQGLLHLLRGPIVATEAGRIPGRIPLAAFCAAPERQALHAALLKARGIEQRVAVLGRWLQGRLCKPLHGGAAQRRVAQAAMWCQQAPDPLDLDDLRRGAGVGGRQLERDFRHWLGISPDAYGRIVRFQRAARAVASGQRLVDTATLFNFADQPHMNRCFRQLAALTPRELALLAATPLRVAERRALAERVLVLDDLSGAGTGVSVRGA